MLTRTKKLVLVVLLGAGMMAAPGLVAPVGSGAPAAAMPAAVTVSAAPASCEEPPARRRPIEPEGCIDPTAVAAR